MGRYAASLAIALGGMLPAMAQQPDKFPSVTFQTPGKVEIVDGDTFWMGIHQVRLMGVDAVEVGQTCSRDGKTFDCHRDSMNYLNTFTSRPDFRCEVKTAKDGRPEMSYGRYVATCYAGTVDINRAMVAAGWALASDKVVGDPYRVIEADALKRSVGLHAAKYEKPWNWRKKKNAGKCSCDEE